jgi:hypothetical protein
MVAQARLSRIAPWSSLNRKLARLAQAAGDALLAEAAWVEAHLLAVGAWTLRRLIELVVGGATRDVLAAGDRGFTGSFESVARRASSKA